MRARSPTGGRDYWRPRLAVHFGAELLRWAMFDFGQGTPAVLVVLTPTPRKQPVGCANSISLHIDGSATGELVYAILSLKLDRLSRLTEAGQYP